MTSIPILYAFARSGGTLVNQLLGVHPRCLVLSEVNPTASYKPMAEQAIEWLKLVEENEMAYFARQPYHLQIKMLHERAAARKKILIIRGWATVNFLPGCYGKNIIPSMQLEQDLYLQRAGLSPAPMVITRRAAEIYRSIRKHFLHLKELDLDLFAQSYLAYAKAMAGLPVITLESLQTQPEESVKKILALLHLDGKQAKQMLRDFAGFTQCTGNNTLETPSESSQARHIMRATEEHSSFTHPALAEADGIFGYE